MNFSDLKMRFVVALIIIALAFVLIGFSQLVFMKLVVGVALLGFTGVAVWEYCDMLNRKGLGLPTTLMIVLSVLTCLSFYMPPFNPYFARLPMVVLAISFFILFASHFNKTERSVAKIASAFLGVCYIGLPLGMLYQILYPMSDKRLLGYGQFWLVYILVVIKTTDVVAYFTGKLFGKRKLAPHLSPGKTIEGTLCGVTASGIVSFAFYLISLRFIPDRVQFPFYFWILLGLAVGLIGQMGDLAESLIKRDCGVKDSNHLPGLGGVLDMWDSLLFGVPFFYFAMGY